MVLLILSTSVALIMVLPWLEPPKWVENTFASVWSKEGYQPFIDNNNNRNYLENKLSILEENSLVSHCWPANPETASEKIYLVTVTGYSSTVEETDDTPFITASGSLVEDGIVAANFLPFDTRVRIPEIYGNKIFTVKDRMNKVYYYNIDIWFAETQKAKEFGVKQTYIEIVQEPNQELAAVNAIKTTAE